MDKAKRNAIETATQRARNVLEEDFAAQLDGEFDVRRDGIAEQPGVHLSPRQARQRDRIVEAIRHKQAAGMPELEDAVTDYLRDAAFTTLNRFVALKMLEARRPRAAVRQQGRGVRRLRRVSAGSRPACQRCPMAAATGSTWSPSSTSFPPR